MSEERIKVPKELTHGPFAVDTGSLMLPGLNIFFLAQPKNHDQKPVFSMCNLLLPGNFTAVSHFQQLTHCPSLTCYK